MANLKRTHHQLAKAEKKLRKYSRSQKQFQIQFVRKQRKTLAWSYAKIVPARLLLLPYISILCSSHIFATRQNLFFYRKEKVPVTQR